MSSSSRIVFVDNAAAIAAAPSSPILLFLSERRRIVEPLFRTAAIALAPTSPMELRPRHNSPIGNGWGLAKAQATARAPTSPSPMPLSSSSGRNGGACLHSILRISLQAAHMRARSEKVGKKSMTCCSISIGKCSHAGLDRASSQKLNAPAEKTICREAPGAGLYPTNHPRDDGISCLCRA